MGGVEGEGKGKKQNSRPFLTLSLPFYGLPRMLSKAMLTSLSLRSIIATTRMRKRVSNFVTSKMILLKSKRLVYKNVFLMRRYGGGMRYHPGVVKNQCEDWNRGIYLCHKIVINKTKSLMHNLWGSLNNNSMKTKVRIDYNFKSLNLALHTAAAPEIWTDQSWMQCKLTRKASKLGNYSH